MIATEFLYDFDDASLPEEPTDFFYPIGEPVQPAAREGAKRFALTPFDQIQIGSAAVYLIKGIIPRTGLTVVWGPPKCGKSFLVFDMAMHVAMG